MAVREADVRTVLERWRTFDLDSKRLHLDKQGLEISHRAEASTVSRYVRLYN